MNRSTCQHCGKKRYQDRMKMINPKSLKNGKPEWACVTCIETNYVQVSAEPILFPNSARHFNGVLMEGEKCGICHHAHGREVCDECKVTIFNCSGYGTATELEALIYKKNNAEDQWTYYKKNPMNLLAKNHTELLLKSLELKIEMLEQRINYVKVSTDRHLIIYNQPKTAVYLSCDKFGDDIERTKVVIGEDDLWYIYRFTDSEEHDSVKPEYRQKYQTTLGFHKSRLIKWADEATDKTYHSKDQDGNIYFLDNKTKEWLIHDGKKTLYGVKKEDELHQYLNDNMYEARH